MDSELRVAYEQFPSAPVPQNANDFVVLRKATDEMLAQMSAQLPKNEHVVIEDRVVPHTPATLEVPIRLYTPVSRTGLLPGLLWIHGGGFTVGSPAIDDSQLTSIVEEVGCIVVSVEYRLAPEHPFPAAPDDCYAALTWLAANAQELGVDGDRLAIAGASAGGGICAAVGLMARDRGEVNLCFQMPLCGCLDDRHITSSSYEITDARTWNRETSLKAWEVYLGTDHGGNVSPYAAPIRATNLAGLPPTYMMVGTLDLMRDENIQYANRLMQAGVPTELHVYPGAYHGFEILAPNSSISQRAVTGYVAALKRALNAR
jgi:acetyl esterase/lipase